MSRLRNTRLYSIWHDMKQRCSNPSLKKYPDYGGRGIRVCKEWEESYRAFERWALGNGYTDFLTLDRRDVNGPYCPDNCRWATTMEQARNRRTNHYITVGIYRHCITDWANMIGQSRRSITMAVSRGIPEAEYIAVKLPNVDFTGGSARC